MYGKIIINILLIFSLVAMEKSLLPNLPWGISYLNLILVALIFILVLNGLDLALGWALGAGFLLDILSFMPFGTFLIILPLIILADNFLLNNFFTNRSLYSFFALTVFTIFSYEFFVKFIYYFYQLIFGDNGEALKLNLNFFIFELKLLIYNLILVFIIFYLISFISRKLKPVFLVRK